VLPSTIRNTVFTVAMEFLVRKHQPTNLPGYTGLRLRLRGFRSRTAELVKNGLVSGRKEIGKWSR